MEVEALVTVIPCRSFLNEKTQAQIYMFIHICKHVVVKYTRIRIYVGKLVEKYNHTHAYSPVTFAHVNVSIKIYPGKAFNN